MARNRIFYLLALILAVIFHSFYSMWFSWYLLVLLLCLPWFSLLFSLPAMLKLKIHATVPKILVRRSTGRMQLHAAASFPMPGCKLTLVLQNTLTGASCRRKARLTSAKVFSVKLPATHCGNLQCFVESFWVYDYLGLFSLPRPKMQLSQTIILPLPNPPEHIPLLEFSQCSQYRVKHGGGMAEVYELRDYHPGDPLRTVHWKLSSKLDSLVVREAMEPVQDPILLTFDLTGSPDDLDSVLDQLAWLSRWLLSKELAHNVLWIDGSGSNACTAVVATEAELKALLRLLLCRPAAQSSQSISSLAFRSSWRYHITPQKEA